MKKIKKILTITFFIAMFTLVAYIDKPEPSNINDIQKAKTQAIINLNSKGVK